MKWNWKDFFNFKRMVTPIIIKGLFWVGVVASVLGGLGVFLNGIIEAVRWGDIGSAFIGLFGGPLAAAVGVLIARLYAELLILIFSINDTLIDIRDLLKDKE